MADFRSLSTNELSRHSSIKQRIPAVTTAMEHRAMKRQQQDDQVRNTIDTIPDPSDQLDAIATIRGWYSPYSSPALLIKQYTSNTLSLQSTISQLAAPIDHLFTSGDNGWLAWQIETTARHQRTNFPEHAKVEWGLEQDISKPDPSHEVQQHPSTENALWALWNAVAHSARKLPWRGKHSNMQGRLLDLVHALKERPSPPFP